MENGPFLLPGDKAMAVPTESSSSLTLGPHLFACPSSTNVISSVPSFLHTKPFPHLTPPYPSSRPQSPHPLPPTVVIGTVLSSTASHHILDIGAAHDALLPVVSFPSATLRSRPHPPALATMLALPTTPLSNHLPTVLTCIPEPGTGPGAHASWSSGEALYGELKAKSATVVSVSLAASRRFASEGASDHGVMGRIGKELSFESVVATGNGRVWIGGESPTVVTLVAEIVRSSGSKRLVGQKERKRVVEDILSQWKGTLF